MKNIIFIFLGQGSQYIGMGKSIFKKFPITRNTFDEVNRICHFDILEFCGNNTYN